MIAERIQQEQETSYAAATTKYYQFSAILEHVIDCFHTIVTDETNPYHPPLAWLTRKQPKPPDDELFLDLYEECSKQEMKNNPLTFNSNDIQLSSSVRSRLEKFPQQLRQEIVSRLRDGCPPLFVACKFGLRRIVKYLIDVCGADIEQRGRFEAFEDHHVHSVTPIWVAAVAGQLDTVKLLIDRGADINSTSDSGSTPLRSVCFLCKDDDGLAQENQDEDDYNFGATSSNDNCDDIYMKIVQSLVEHGADIERSNHNGVTCLINSLHNYRLTSYFIAKGVNVNASDNRSKTALHYAIQQDRLAVTKLLLANKADPYLMTKTGDDALRLSCIGGYEKIFLHLIENFNYDQRTISDAYKLLGSSILEIHCDLAQVRYYWTQSIKSNLNQQQQTVAATSFHSTTQPSNCDDCNLSTTCDNKRWRAFGALLEFENESTLQSLSVDDFRIQSLIISERVLGSSHRETIQRLLYRGTFYIKSLRPRRCLDLWIYALELRLNYDSIFHFESIFAAQAITKLFLDLFDQRHYQQVRFNDVHDVLTLLVERIDECQSYLSFRPRSCLHEDIYDLLLNMIVNLLLIMRCVRRHSNDFLQADNLIARLLDLNPKTTNGSSLLHLCVAPNMFEGEAYRSIQAAASLCISSSMSSMTLTNGDILTTYDSVVTTTPHQQAALNLVDQQQQPTRIATKTTSTKKTPVLQLIESLIDAGMEVDLSNENGLSALQNLCLATNIRMTDKRNVIELLIRKGAHVDRRALTPEQDEQIRQALRECGIKPIQFITLKCLAARKVSESKLLFDKTRLANNLNESIAIH